MLTEDQLKAIKSVMLEDLDGRIESYYIELSVGHPGAPEKSPLAGVQASAVSRTLRKAVRRALHSLLSRPGDRRS
jgi:hypothetical protein